MIFVLLLAAFDANSVRATAQHPQMTREGAIQCGLHFTDVDPVDGVVSRHELEIARCRALGKWSWFGAPLLWVGEATGQVESVDQVLANCDANGDGMIDAEDYAASAATCLNSDEKIEEVYKYVCLPGAEREKSED